MINRLIGAAVAGTMFLFGLSVASAQTQAQLAQMESRFAAADKNGDGKLTPDEAKAGMPRVSQNFAKIDRGNKGYVTIDDIKAAMSMM